MRRREDKIRSKGFLSRQGCARKSRVMKRPLVSGGEGDGGEWWVAVYSTMEEDEEIERGTGRGVPEAW